MNDVVRTDDLQLLPVGVLRPWKQNPRRTEDAAAQAELTASVRAKGVLTPLLVRATSAPGPEFEVIAGNRRLAAAKAAGLEHVPVVIRQIVDVEALELAMVENLLRDDLSPLDEAEAYRKLLGKAGVSEAAVRGVAARVHKSPGYVHRRVKLVDLVPKAAELLRKGELGVGHAELLARLQPKDQVRALDSCFERSVGGRRELAALGDVRQWIVRNVHLDLSRATFDKADAALVPEAGPCTTCPKRTGNEPSLFADVEKGDTCTDPACFQSKVAAFTKLRTKELEKRGDELVRVSGEWGSGNSNKALEKKGILPMGSWQSVPKGRPDCQWTKQGLVAVAGRSEELQLGSEIKVCLRGSKCPIHGHVTDHSSRGNSGMRLDVKKREIEERFKQERRRRIFGAIANVPDELAFTPAALRLVVSSLVSELIAEHQKVIYGAFAIEPDGGTPKISSNADGTKALAPLVARADYTGLVRMLFAATFVHYGRYEPWKKGKDFLLEVAELLKIDVKAIEKAIAGEKAAALAKFKERVKKLTSAARKPKKGAEKPKAK